VGEECILLALVEPMHFIHEQKRIPALGLFTVAGPFHHLANFLNATEDCRDGFEGKVADIGQQASKGGFSDSGRTPENHGMQLPLFHGPAQGFARADQMSLADIAFKRGRPHTSGQGLKAGLSLKQAVLHQAPSRITSTPSG
jgi:hypothetical protein